jgi:hypothetical protein
MDDLTFVERYFKYDHLPAFLQDISRPFSSIALDMLRALPGNEERHVMLRKLLEAKDCAVRCAVAGDLEPGRERFEVIHPAPPPSDAIALPLPADDESVMPDTPTRSIA